MINYTPCGYRMDIFTDLEPIKILLEYLKGLINAKVTR